MDDSTTPFLGLILVLGGIMPISYGVVKLTERRIIWGLICHTIGISMLMIGVFLCFGLNVARHNPPVQATATAGMAVPVQAAPARVASK